MNPASAAVAAIYFRMQENLSDILEACAPEQRAAVRAQFVLARQNYNACLNQAFHANDPALDALVQQADAAAVAIENIGNQLGNYTKVIQTLTTAVSVGSKIAAKIIV
ncbi:hypothetical protein [Terriglobus sp.]|uniref:hypothetical protein n=1 Tax=Terriglobus sp. TaxID=1889013 RepID=UPI003B00372C